MKKEFIEFYYSKNKGKIFKKTEKGYKCLSPKPIEVTSENLPYLYLRKISKCNADSILAEEYRNYKTKWQYCGETFTVGENFGDGRRFDCPIHFEDDYKLGYYIGWYRNRLIWFRSYQSSSSCIYYYFKDINTPPAEASEPRKWVKLHNIKPVYCKNRQCYI